MSSSIKVSVAIPAYKADFLSEAIQSVLCQTIKDIELIIVNDCSPENIDEIVGQFHDSRIKYYVNDKNYGGEDPSENWNRCLSYAQGEFFALLCDDDVYEPKFLEKMLLLAEKYPLTNVFRSRVKIIDANNQEIDYYPSSPEYEESVDYIFHKVSNFRRQTISEFLYRRSHIVHLGGYTSLPKAWCADDVSVFRFAMDGGIASTQDLLVSFRMSGQNISTNDSRYIIEKVKAHKLYTEWIKDIIKNEEKGIKEIILSKRKLQEYNVMVNLLKSATWHDLRYLFVNRDKYSLSNKCIFKALAKKLKESIR